MFNSNLHKRGWGFYFTFCASLEVQKETVHMVLCKRSDIHSCSQCQCCLFSGNFTALIIQLVYLPLEKVLDQNIYSEILYHQILHCLFSIFCKKMDCSPYTFALQSIKLMMLVDIQGTHLLCQKSQIMPSIFEEVLFSVVISNLRNVSPLP